MPQLLHFLDEQQPDIVCAQEVLTTPDGFPKLSTNYDVHERLAKQFGHHFFAPTITFDKDRETVTQGNAIYAKRPLEDKRTIFTAGTFSDTKPTGAFDYNVRNIQLCTLDLDDNKSLTVANHHGYHEKNPTGSKNSVESMQRAAVALVAIAGPLIVCGDFNVNPESPAMCPLDSLGLRNLSVEHGLQTTLNPISHVKVPIVCDYTLVSGEVQVVKFDSSDQLVSDHKAQITTFQIAK